MNTKRLIILLRGDQALHAIVQPLLFKNGYKWLLDEARVRNAYAGALFAYPDGTLTHGDAGYALGERRNNDILIDLATQPITRLLEALNLSRVKLNDKYTAVIHKERKEVEIGCQKFPFSAVTELYKAIQ